MAHALPRQASSAPASALFTSLAPIANLSTRACQTHVRGSRRAQELTLLATPSAPVRLGAQELFVKQTPVRVIRLPATQPQPVKHTLISPFRAFALLPPPAHSVTSSVAVSMVALALSSTHSRSVTVPPATPARFVNRLFIFIRTRSLRNLPVTLLRTTRQSLFRSI